MLRAVARPLVNVVERWMPNALVFAIVLTFVVALMALGLTDSGPVEIVRGWGDGLAGLLDFIAQISIVLVLGYTLAHTGPVERMLRRIASFPRTPAMAYGFVTVVAGLASLISWGLGLIVGGIVSVEVARSARTRDTHSLPAARRLRLLGVRSLAHGLFGLGASRRRHARQLP